MKMLEGKTKTRRRKIRLRVSQLGQVLNAGTSFFCLLQHPFPLS
jgi:hypothetical protein